MEKQIKNRFKKLEGRVEKIEKTLSGEGLSREGRLVKCRCGKSWITRSKADLVSCPKCGNKVRIKDKKSIKELRKKPEEIIEKIRKGFNELVTCFKCKKKLKKKDAVFRYNHYFHPKCGKEFDKDAGKEVDRVFGKAGEKGVL